MGIELPIWTWKKVQPQTLFGMQHANGPAGPQDTVQSSSTWQLVDVLPPELVVRPPLPVLPPEPAPPAPPVFAATQALESSSMYPVSHVKLHWSLEQLGVEFVGTGSVQPMHPVSPQPTPGDG